MSANDKLLSTTTGEFFQPVRLHYRVFDPQGLVDAFKKLRCVQWDATQGRRVWLYQDEAKHLRFQRSYDQFPAHMHPIVIGSIWVRTQDTMLLDVRSYARALAAIPFFDQHIPRSVARVTEADVTTKLYTAEDRHLTPDLIFDRQPSTSRDPEAFLEEMRGQLEHIQDPMEKLAFAAAHLEAQMRQPFPEVEHLYVHFYEDGIGGFQLALQIRQNVAVQHAMGNTDYSMADVVGGLVEKMQPGPDLPRTPQPKKPRPFKGRHRRKR